MKLKLNYEEAYRLRSLLIRTARGGGKELSPTDQATAQAFADRLAPGTDAKSRERKS